MSATTQININGQIVEASSVTLPSTGRSFRNAWTLNGDVIEVDMAKAIDIKIAKIIEKANEKAAKAEEKSLAKAFKGQDTSVEDAEVAKYKSKPKATAVALIAAATTPEQLDAITEDQVFG